MKHRLILCLLSALILPSPLVGQILSWDFEDLNTDQRESGANPDYFFDPDGTVHVSFWDQQRDVLMYGTRSASTGAWTFDRPLDNVVSYGAKSAIAVDESGNVHIAFHDKNASDEAVLRYATNASGVWTMESPGEGIVVGPYGFDFFAPRMSQGSLDIDFTLDGRPFITVYDGDADNLNACVAAQIAVYTQYDLDLTVLEKDGTGAWVTHDLPDLPDKTNSGCLPSGDRFGEFCQIIPRDSGNFFILTNSMHNHELILFANDSARLDNWVPIALDSVENITLPGVLRFYETFDHPRAILVGDTALHIVSTVSWLYGSEVTVLNRNPMLYYQWKVDPASPDSLTLEQSRSFLPNNSYRSYFSLSAIHPDTIYLPNIRVRDNQLEIQYSFNGGGFWSLDTLDFLSTIHRLESQIIGDSLYIWGFDQLKNALVEYALPKDLSSMTKRYITVSERRGRLVDSEVDSLAGEPGIHLIYTEDFRDQIRYTTRVGSTWPDELVTTLDEITSLDLIRKPDQETEILYSGGKPAATFSASHNGTQWISTQIAPFGLQGISSFTDDDSVYVAGSRIPSGELIWLSKSLSGSSWTQRMIDTFSMPTGQSPVIASYQDSLYLVYYSSGGNLIRWARRAEGQSWIFQNITQPQNYIPLNLDFGITGSGRPVIAFKDGNTDRIFLMERISGDWEINPVPTDPGNLIGSPLSLILDSRDRPWILYNFPDVQDDMRLLRRNASGNWIGVSILNNTGQIANEFDFHLLGDDFYILGKKNDADNEGIGMLYAENGVRTSLQAEINPLSLRVVPNPASDQAVLRFDLQAAGQGSLEIYNLQGQLMHSDMLNYHAGTQEYRLPVALLGPGSYVVAVQTESARGHATLLIVP